MAFGGVPILGLFLGVVAFVLQGCSNDPQVTENTSPAMVHYSQIMDRSWSITAESQPDVANAVDIAFSTVDSKEMTAGLYRLKNDNGTAATFERTYRHEVFMLVIDGEFVIETSAGQTLTANTGSAYYFPTGTRATFSTPDAGIGYFVTQRGTDRAVVENATAVDEAIAFKPVVQQFPNMVAEELPLLDNTSASLSFLKDFLISAVPGKELAGGLYRLNDGPHLFYKYEYEEFKYIVEGQFNLTDGTGQFVEAKAGDLMYFPKDSEIHFTSPSTALGFFVGQRLGGTA